MREDFEHAPRAEYAFVRSRSDAGPWGHATHYSRSAGA